MVFLRKLWNCGFLWCWILSADVCLNGKVAEAHAAEVAGGFALPWDVGVLSCLGKGALSIPTYLTACLTCTLQ
jgi:hypothetical protein